MIADDRLRDLEEQRRAHDSALQNMDRSIERVIAAVQAHDQNNSASMQRLMAKLDAMEVRLDALERTCAQVEGASILVRWAGPVLVALAGAAAWASNFIHRGQ